MTVTLDVPMRAESAPRWRRNTEIPRALVTGFRRRLDVQGIPKDGGRLAYGWLMEAVGHARAGREHLLPADVLGPDNSDDVRFDWRQRPAEAAAWVADLHRAGTTVRAVLCARMAAFVETGDPLSQPPLRGRRRVPPTP